MRRRAARRQQLGWSGLRCERGFALPLALAIVLALTIAVSAVIKLSSANTRSASLGLALQDAKAVAEGGLNSAVAIIGAAPTTAILPDCTTWSPWITVASGEEVRWCGTYNSITKTWTVKGQGRVANPTGPAAAQVRTVQAQLELVSDVGAWNFVWVRPAPGSCMQIKNAFVMEAPLYVVGCLQLENEARYAGPHLYVTGTIETKNTASVGTAAAPVPWVSVRNNAPAASGCRNPWSGPYVLPCGPSQRVWTNQFDSDVPEIQKPPADHNARYADAAPWDSTRGHSCTSTNLAEVNSKLTANTMDDNGVKDKSLGVFNLMPSVPYDCQQRAGDGTLLGRLQWTGTNPGTLTITGTFYIDGDLETANTKRGVVNGSGSIYVTNKIVLQSNSWLCGVADCGLSWDPNMDPPHLLFLYAGYDQHPAIEVKSDSKFQGGLYAVGGIKVSNNGYVHGPAVADQVEAENGADFNPWPWFVELPAGAEGSGPPTLRLRPGSWRG